VSPAPPRLTADAHNHFAHSALTRYSLGAPPALLQADWDYDRGYLALLDPREDGREKDVEGLPDKITRDNWRDKSVFGKRGAHSLYLAFFHGEVQRLGIDAALREYLLSPAANAGDISMLCALLAGVVHPFIHLGLGLEFDDPMVVAEGLAQACQHDPTISGALYPPGWPEAQLKNTSGKPSKSLLGLYVEYLENPVLDEGPYDTTILINDRLRQAITPERVPVLHDLVARWDVSDLSDAGVAARVEEVSWVAALLCGTTSRPGYKTRIDFFLVRRPETPLMPDAPAHLVDVHPGVHAPAEREGAPHHPPDVRPHPLPHLLDARPPRPVPRGRDGLARGPGGPPPARRRGCGTAQAPDDRRRQPRAGQPVARDRGE
jgi:hypothetical protein